MKTNISILLTATLAVAFSACTTSRYARQGEYDDVYYSSADRQLESEQMYEDEGVDVYTNEGDDNSTYRAERYRVESYQDEIYDEDDFYYSRRLRRFNSNSNSWRYFDPYFSNDLYFVMGTNSWNRWNNFGWYSWNRPRFGASFRFGGYNPFIYNGIYNSWANGYNSYYGYYNPWVNSYYNYDPFFAYTGYPSYYSPFGFGGGFGGGFGNPWCPPISSNYYAYGNTGFISSTPNGRRTVFSRRQSLSNGARTNTAYRPVNNNSRASRNRVANTADGRKVATQQAYTSTRIRENEGDNNRYFTPRQRIEPVTQRNYGSSNAIYNNSSRRRTTNGTFNSTRPANSNRNISTSRNQSGRKSYSTSPRSNRSSYSTRPSNRSRNYSTPRNSSRNNSYTRPSSSNRSRTFSRPSSSNRSFSRPSSSSSSRVRPSSSSSSSSRRRP